MTADDFNSAELVAGRLTTAHITELVRRFQRDTQLEADGKFGPNTRSALEQLFAPPDKAPALKIAWPLPTLRDGRKPHITSEFRPADRPDHDGLDMFYRWRNGDEPDFVGDKGCAGRNADGTPKWVVPYGICAIAAAGGKVMIAGNSPTGYRAWIDHGNGWRTGYFHLLGLEVNVGQVLEAGARIGLIGDSPRGSDGRHLHFELSPVDRYAPTDPTPYLR